MWVRRLEEADRVRRPGVEVSDRRSTSNADPIISRTAITSLLRAASSISSPAPPRQSTPPPLPPPTENSQIARNDAQEDAHDGAAAAVSQVKTPVRQPTASPMKRSYSSPAQRSDAPSPSQRGCNGVPLFEADFSGVSDRLPASDAVVNADRHKRRRVKGPEGHVGPALGLRATLPAILPSFPSRPYKGDAALTRSSSDPTTFAVWTLVPPPLGGPQRTPCHASLDRSNYVETPWDVLRAAGHAVKTSPDASESPSPTLSSRRLGYIFVAEECEREFLMHLRKGLEKESGRALSPTTTVLKPVLVLTMTAFHRGFSFASARVQHLILASV